jgi:hypothetical protein
MREDVVIIAGLVEQLKKIADRWQTNMKKPPMKFIGYIRASSRFAARAIRELDNDLDKYEQDRLIRMAETTTFQLNYVKHDLSSKVPGAITYDITEDERDNIVEALAEVRCANCDGRVKDCKVREQFFKWDITPIHEVTDNIYPCSMVIYELYIVLQSYL